MVSQSDLLPMMMDTSGGAAGLLALRERESLLAIKGAQRFEFHHIVPGGGQLLTERRDLSVRDCSSYQRGFDGRDFAYNSYPV